MKRESILAEAVSVAWIERTKGEDGEWTATPHYGTALKAENPKARVRPARKPVAPRTKRQSGKRPLGRMASR